MLARRVGWEAVSFFFQLGGILYIPLKFKITITKQVIGHLRDISPCTVIFPSNKREYLTTQRGLNYIFQIDK